MIDTHTVVLVEGASDKAAVEALAERHGRNLEAEGVAVVSMGGATNIGTYVGRFGPRGRDLRLAGLCDAGEEPDFRRTLERLGLKPNPRLGVGIGPSHGLGLNLGTGPAPGPGPGVGPGIGLRPGAEPTLGPGPGLGPRPGPEPGTGSGLEPGIGAGASLEPGAGAGPGPETETGPGLEPGIGAGAGLGPGPGLELGPGLEPEAEAGLGAGAGARGGRRLSRADLEAIGFFVCVADLEDELIRALGTDGVEQVIDAEGDLGSFRTLQRQPAWREGDTHAQLRRFMGAGSGRKIRYSSLLVAALDLDRTPRPLAGLLAYL